MYLVNKKKSEINVWNQYILFIYIEIQFPKWSHHCLSELRIEAEILKNSNSFFNFFDPSFECWFTLYIATSLSSGLSSWVPVISAIISVFVSLPCDVLTSMSKSYV